MAPCGSNSAVEPQSAIDAIKQRFSGNGGGKHSVIKSALIHRQPNTRECSGKIPKVRDFPASFDTRRTQKQQIHVDSFPVRGEEAIEFTECRSRTGTLGMN